MANIHPLMNIFLKHARDASTATLQERTVRFITRLKTAGFSNSQIKSIEGQISDGILLARIVEGVISEHTGKDTKPTKLDVKALLEKHDWLRPLYKNLQTIYRNLSQAFADCNLEIHPDLKKLHGIERLAVEKFLCDLAEQFGEACELTGINKSSRNDLMINIKLTTRCPNAIKSFYTLYHLLDPETNALTIAPIAVQSLSANYAPLKISLPFNVRTIARRLFPTHQQAV